MQRPDAPAWLVAYHEQRGSSVPVPTPPKVFVPKPAPPPKPVVIKAPPPPPRPRPPSQPQSYRKDVFLGIVEPERWDYDGGARREPVIDKDSGRVIRRVGWHHCLRCRSPFFSEDVIRLRLCDGAWDGCRENDERRR